MKCIVCNFRDGSVQSPAGNWHCEECSLCPHCGGSVANFVKRYIHGTVTVEAWLCPCVVEHGREVHNAVLLAREKARKEASPKTSKLKRKVS